MNKFRFTIKLLVSATFLLAFASLAQAQATRTWVSGVGDDVNPCSRTAPCKTYAGAISKTAVGGEISTLDPGGFGAVTITKSITIEGTQGAGFGSILASLTTGVNVNDSTTASPNTIVVNLRNLYLQGIGPTGANPGTNGISFTSGKSLNIENCFINGFTSAAANGIGINVNMATATATEVYIRNTTVQNCRIGIRVNSTAGGSFVVATMNNVNVGHMVGNGGVTGGDGIRLESNAFAEIRDSNIAFALGGSNAGVAITGTGGASIINTTIAHCQIGINITAGSTNRITHSQILSNGTAGVQFAGGGVLRSYGDNVYDNGTNFAGGAISPQGQQ